VANSAAMRFVVAAAVVLVAAACGGTKTVTVTQTTTVVRTVTTTAPTSTTTPANASACKANELSGTFAVVEGSAGAGQISYRLTLKNTGSSPCSVSGIPQVQLVGTTGAALPTSPSAEPGQGPGAKVVLQPGDSASAEARFSPDVTGTGDNQSGQCQPTATVLRVTASGGGTLDAPVQPPTPVCERGSLHFRPFSAS
jgi:Protein of unknown function (DUF4232)